MTGCAQDLPFPPSGIWNLLMTSCRSGTALTRATVRLFSLNVYNIPTFGFECRIVDNRNAADIPPEDLTGRIVRGDGQILGSRLRQYCCQSITVCPRRNFHSCRVQKTHSRICHREISQFHRYFT